MLQDERYPFENTEIYKKALDQARLCRQICSSLPKGLYSDADQLRRASLSVCNNYAEGYGRWHKNDKKQFYSISRGSAYECIPVVTLFNEESLITDEQYQAVRENVSQVTRMLSGMIQGLDKRKS